MMKPTSEERWLAAVLDEQTEPGQIETALTELSSDAELRARWGRYQLIHDALRGEPVCADYHHIASRVAAQLNATQAVPCAVSSHAESRARWLRRFSNAFRRLGGRLGGRHDGARSGRAASRWIPITGAALASLAALALVIPQGDPLIVSEVPEPITSLSPEVTHERTSVAQTPWSAGQPSLDAKLNELLLGHQERVSESGIKGFMPYATLVGYQVHP